MHPVDKAYYLSVTSDGSGPIDHSFGRVQLIGGDMFFSPNSRRDVKRPMPYNQIPSRDSKRHQFTEFLEPLWWIPDCPYLPFVPVRPVYAGVPFQDLFNVPLYFPRSRTGFIFDYQYVLGWARVEKLLVDSIRRLLNQYRAPPITWIASTAIGCTGAFVRARDLRESVLNSRGWFSQWMAGLSYAIAISKSLKNESLDDMWPAWFTFLSEQRFTQIWLSGIRSSLVSTFTPSVDRVGVFLQLIHPHREQPSVDWFCRYSIPVWYPWGQREIEAARSDPRLARFAPAPYQLQEATTFLSKSPEPPSMPEPSSSRSQPSFSTKTFDCAATSVVIPSWKEFFENRRLRNEHRMARETPRERQSRESREKNPPTKKTKVFLWSRNEGGGYTRESFFQSENGAHLDSFGENQKVYDAFSNEWDCCEEFGEFTDHDVAVAGDNDGSDDEYPSMPLPISVTDAAMDPAEPLHNDEERRFDVDPPTVIDFDWEDLETSALLYQFLGFVAPLPIPNRPSTIDEEDRSFFSTVVGLQRIDSPFFESPVASFALEFLQHLDNLRTPPNASWDIGTGNRLWIAESNMFWRMRVIERFDDKNRSEKWYVFDFKDRASVPWMIALRHVVNALYVCRLDRPGQKPLLDFEVARELLNRGIQFSTLLPLKSLPPTIAPSITVPVRLFGYKFTVEDYHAYEQERAALLKDPRIARAALLRGGIVWRLAVATMSFDDVLHGPTIAATVFRRGNIFRTADNSIDLCDDGLSQAELDVLCGLHYCQNKQGHSYSRVSWWPTDSSWQNFAQHTHWTEKVEDWYVKRLEKIRQGKEGPLNASKWRTDIRGSSSLRRIDKFVTQAFDRFVVEHVTA